MKNIGIITSGGDCGGLNAVVKGTAAMAYTVVYVLGVFILFFRYLLFQALQVIIVSCIRVTVRER